MDTNPTGGTASGTTGTRNVTYDLTAVLYHALQGVENCQIYTGDANGSEAHRRFFQHAAQVQKKLAEEAKQLLHDCLMAETTGGSQQGQATSAFGQQGMSAGGGTSGGMTGEIASLQAHSFDQAREDGSAFRFASGETQGGSDQFEGTDQHGRQNASLAAGQQVGGTPNGAGSAEHAEKGELRQHDDQGTTGGGSTSRF